MQIILLVLIALVFTGLIHVAEETLTGFIKRSKEFVGFPISASEDVVVNVIFIVALAIGALVYGLSGRLKYS